ncbi:MAG: adenine deaminase [Proteobacteria bacterium]|nr:adenine deaminase [Pseudomonadota bacterium]
MKISANIVDVLNSIIYPGIIDIQNGKIAAISRNNEKYDTFILPGFVDAHVHIESSMLAPSEFSRLAAMHGTVATVSDPHEIANVLGMDGIKFMIENGKSVPFKFYFGAPPCVPATVFETAGASLGQYEIETLLESKEIKYLSEMMNFPGVIEGDPDVMAKIEIAKKNGKPIDGHAPGLRGEALKRYIDAGISTDHETFQYDEGEEKLSMGMKLLLREGSAAKNFDVLSHLIAKYPEQCMLCSDDKHPDDLVAGHINGLVKRAVIMGIDKMIILKCACVNPVLHYGLDVGLLRAGDDADFIEIDDLNSFNVLKTYIKGRIVAENGKSLLSHATVSCINNFKTGMHNTGEFAMKARGNKVHIKVHIIEAINHQVITGSAQAILKQENGYIVPDIERDILKIAVVNRYKNLMPAIGFVKNFGLVKGAIASSVSHDSHNIIAVGATDEDICSAVNLVIEHKGGLAVSYDNVREILPLPIAGLMSDEDGFSVARQYSRIDRLAKQLGSHLDAPFMTLSFMALLVIPKLKLSDRGLFDGEYFKFVNVFEE